MKLTKIPLDFDVFFFLDMVALLVMQLRRLRRKEAFSGSDGDSCPRTASNGPRMVIRLIK